MNQTEWPLTLPVACTAQAAAYLHWGHSGFGMEDGRISQPAAALCKEQHKSLQRSLSNECDQQL